MSQVVVGDAAIVLQVVARILPVAVYNFILYLIDASRGIITLS